MTKEIILYLFESLKEQNIKYCILRNYDGLPDDLGGHDVDILVNRKDKRAVHSVMEAIQNNFDAKWIRVGERQYVISYYLSYSENSEMVLLQLDFFYAMDWHGRTMLTGEYILNNRILYNGFYVPRPAHEAVTSLFSSLIRGGFYKEKYHDSIKAMMAKDKDEFMYALNNSVGKLSAQLTTYIENDDIGLCEALVPKLRNEITKKCLMTHPVKTISDMVGFVWWEMRNRVYYAGNSFAVVGINSKQITNVIMPLIFKYYKNEGNAEEYIIDATTLPKGKVKREIYYLKKIHKKLNKTYGILYSCSGDVNQELSPIKTDMIFTFDDSLPCSYASPCCALKVNEDLYTQIEQAMIDIIIQSDKSIYKGFIHLRKKGNG